MESLRKTSGPDSDVPDTFMNLTDLLAWINRLDPAAVATVANLSQVG